MTRRILLLVAFAIVFSSCTTTRFGQVAFIEERPAECQTFLENLDKTVAIYGVKDASTEPVSGFPYLRTNRFIEARKPTWDMVEARNYWFSWMQELDLEARKKEINNLPDEIVLSLVPDKDGKPDREGLYDHVISCSYKLLNYDGCQPSFFDTLRPRVRVPDEYSLTMRTFGLYPLAWLPINMVTHNVRNKFKAWYEQDITTLSPMGKLTTFFPPRATALSQEEREIIIVDTRKNPLQIPRPDDRQAFMLASAFAPVFIQDIDADFDRFGRIMWEKGALKINVHKPAVYYYLSHAYVHEIPVLQINYVIWFSAREGENAPRMERGPMDGMTVRISLDYKARPFMVDVMNNCGCYHFFSPMKNRVEETISRSFALNPFVPQWLPKLPAGSRVGLRINSGWHQVERLFAATASAHGATYDLIPYHMLEMLPDEHEKTASIFDMAGIVKGSDRIEPYILFSAGISSIGSMRQRGNHPISLTGRNHFDDPYLFEKNFVFKSP